MFNLLFWKEYRQQRALVLSVIIICGFVQFFRYIWISYNASIAIGVPVYAIAMFITMLFAASSTAIVFCSEHEEKTFDVLRNAPISGTLVASAKIAWCLCGTIAVLIGTLIVSACIQAVLLIEDASSTKLVFGVIGFGVLEGFCWGLFWSTRRKKQVEALLATYFSATIGLYLVIRLYDLVFFVKDPFFPGLYAEVIPFRLLLLIPVAIFAVRGAIGWLRKIETKTSFMFQPQRAQRSQSEVAPIASVNSALSVVGQSPFQSLCWITVRQSRWMILYGLAVHLLLAVYFWSFYLYRDDLNVQPNDATFIFLFVLGWLSALVFCGSVFWSDHKNNGTKLLIHCGVSPAKIWWSRILVFGAVYWIPAAILLLPLFVRIILPVTEGQLIVLFFIFIYTSLFCIGQFFSLAIRRGIVAIFFIALAFIAFYVYGGVLGNVFGCSPLWTMLPVMLAIFAASRLHVNDWAKNRNSLRVWRLPLAVIAVPVLCIMIAFPLVRVYSVPVIDYGYKMDPVAVNMPLDPGSLWSQMPDSLKTPHISNIRSFHPELLQQEIAKLPPQIDPKQFIRRELIQASYEFDARRILSGRRDENGGVMNRKASLWAITPWEKARAMRLLNIEFQRVMRDFDQLDQAGCDEWLSQWNEDSHKYLVFYSDPRMSSLGVDAPWMTSFDRFAAIIPLRRFTVGLDALIAKESDLRVYLLMDALSKWYQQHGSYPDTLEELQGTFLEKIPKTPFSNMPYIYELQLSGSIILQDPFRYHRQLPRLWVLSHR